MDGTACDMGGIDARTGMLAGVHPGRAGFFLLQLSARGSHSILKSARDNLPWAMTSFHARGMATPAGGPIDQVGPPYVRASQGYGLIDFLT